MDSFYIKLVVIFAIVNGIGIAFYQNLQVWGISDMVGAIGNIVLASITGVSFYFNYMARRAPNPHAFVRLVYVSILLKLLVCLSAIIIYALIFGAHMSRNTIFLLMLLYLIYTFLEINSIINLPKRLKGEHEK